MVVYEHKDDEFEPRRAAERVARTAGFVVCPWTHMLQSHLFYVKLSRKFWFDKRIASVAAAVAGRATLRAPERTPELERLAECYDNAGYVTRVVLGEW